MRKLFALAVLCASSALAQSDTFTVSYSATLAGATTALSIQLPDTGSYQVEVIDATAQCSAACPIRLERNGAAAVANGSTINAVAPAALNPETTPAALQTTPNVNAFSGSGVPAGTVVSPVWTIPAGGILPLGGGRVLTGSGGTTNYILRIPTSYTGDVTLYFTLRVRR